MIHCKIYKDIMCTYNRKGISFRQNIHPCTKIDKSNKITESYSQSEAEFLFY